MLLQSLGIYRLKLLDLIHHLVLPKIASPGIAQILGAIIAQEGKTTYRHILSDTEHDLGAAAEASLAKHASKATGIQQDSSRAGSLSRMQGRYSYRAEGQRQLAPASLPSELLLSEWKKKTNLTHP